MAGSAFLLLLLLFFFGMMITVIINSDNRGFTVVVSQYKLLICYFRVLTGILSEKTILFYAYRYNNV